MTDPIFTFVLTVVVEAILGTLTGKVTDELWEKLKGDAAKHTFRQALGVAIQRYATSGSRLELIQPLLQQDSVLKDPTVVLELSQLIRSERKPNAQLLGERWRAALENPPQWRNFTNEAEVLLHYFETELQATEIFRPVLMGKTINEIAAGISVSTQSLLNIETELTNLANLIHSRFGALTGKFTNAPSDIRDQIYDYTGYVEEATRDFVGRQFVFDKVQQFIDNNPRGYFFIRGEPGIGKSSLAAQMVKMNGYLHHFNIRSEGLNKAANFLKNICAQLIAIYELPHASLPSDAIQDAGFFNRLLGEVSTKLNTDSKAIIIVDALDEVDTSGVPLGVNRLYLPQIVPENVYIIITMRNDEKFKPLIKCEQGQLIIVQNSADNVADIRAKVKQVVKRPGIQAYIRMQNIDDDTFTQRLEEKSQGNFMYLRYVLPEIESGSYKDLHLEAIPVGLQSYYEDHWQRMRGQNEESWFTYKLPIIMALTVVPEPISIDLIASFSKVPERPRIRSVLAEWSQFLHETQVEHQGDWQKRYRIYHASFHDFIARKEEVADERVNQAATHEQIADVLWAKLFPNE